MWFRGCFNQMKYSRTTTRPLNRPGQEYTKSIQVILFWVFVFFYVAGPGVYLDKGRHEPRQYPKTKDYTISSSSVWVFRTSPPRQSSNTYPRDFHGLPVERVSAFSWPMAIFRTSKRILLYPTIYSVVLVEPVGVAFVKVHVVLSLIGWPKNTNRSSLSFWQSNADCVPLEAHTQKPVCLSKIELGRHWHDKNPWTWVLLHTGQRSPNKINPATTKSTAAVINTFRMWIFRVETAHLGCVINCVVETPDIPEVVVAMVDLY